MPWAHLKAGFHAKYDPAFAASDFPFLPRPERVAVVIRVIDRVFHGNGGSDRSCSDADPPLIKPDSSCSRSLPASAAVRQTIFARPFGKDSIEPMPILFARQCATRAPSPTLT